MRKEKFIISTLILIIGGFLTKALGMIIKIVMNRMMGPDGIGLYMLVLPTFSLFIGLTQFGFPIAISKLVAEDKKDNKKIIFSILPISLIINIIIITFLIIITPIIARDLLHEARSYYPLLAVAVVLPFTSLSGILRSYFFGKQKMLPHVISNITEDIIRLILIIIGIPLFISKGISVAVTFVILTNIISEFTSILVLFFFLPKNTKIKKEDLKINYSYLKDTFNICIPNTTSRLIGSVGYFLEPIIITFALMRCGYSNAFIIREYGVLTGYVFPLLLLPSFFTLAISQALLPVISKNYANDSIKNVKRKIKQGIAYSLILGIPITVFFIFFPSFLLKIIYHTEQGINYIKVLAPIFLLQYIQAPLAYSIDAMGKSKINMNISLIGAITRSIFLLSFSLLKIGIWGLVIATSINIILTTLLQIIAIKKLTKK